MTAVRLELDGLRALGVKAVTLNLNFPVLYPPFHQSQADYDLRGGPYDTPSGVAGLQFQIDGANVGPEQTTPAYGTDRYSVYWLAVNTAGFARGAHTITAVARDGAGNLGVSPLSGSKISNR